MEGIFSNTDFPNDGADNTVRQPPSIDKIYHQACSQFCQLLDESALYENPFFRGFVEGYFQVLQDTASAMTGTYEERLSFFTARLILSDQIWYNQHLKHLSDNGIDQQSVRVNPFDAQRQWRVNVEYDEGDLIGRTLVEYTIQLGLQMRKILIPENTQIRLKKESNQETIIIEFPGGVTLECEKDCFPPYGILLHPNSYSFQ